jgi:hypothetical protein
VKHNLLPIALLIPALAGTASAGTLEGKVSSGNSVVYVDAIPGKTFPAPSKSVTVSQRLGAAQRFLALRRRQ